MLLHPCMSGELLKISLCILMVSCKYSFFQSLDLIVKLIKVLLSKQLLAKNRIRIGCSRC